jgi:TP901 family phage tail tape measure protein
MQDLGALRARLLLEAKQFKEGMQDARQEMLKSGRAANESSKEMKKIKESMKALEDSKKHAEEAAKSLDKVGKSLREVGLSSKQIDKIEEQIRKTNPQILEKEIKDVREELVKLGISSKEIDKITNEMRNANSAVEQFQIGLNEIQIASLAVGVAVGAGIGASVKVAATFEKQMSNVKAVSGATAQEMDKLSDMAMKLGESTSFSANEVAMGMEELIKSGLSVEQILNGGLAGALDLAAAGELDLAAAAEIASTALNAFRDDGLSVSKAADILAGAANASATSVSELKFGLSAVSAVASSAGLSFEDTTTALALFAQNGIKGSDAGTSLKTMLANLSPSTKEATELMKKLGLITKDGSNQFYDAKGNLKSLAEITDVLRNSLDELDPQERGDALEQLFGSDAVRAGSVLFKEGAEGVEKMAAAMGKISAADVAKVKLDNLISSFEEFKGTLETVGIKIGNEFLPAFKEIVNSGTDVLRVFSDLDPAVVVTGIKMAGAGAGTALLLSTFGKLNLAIKAMQISMGPAGWLILGLSTLAAVLVGASDQMNKYAEVNTKAVDAMAEQYTSNTEMINQYERLQQKLLLSNDEFERLVDLNARIKNETDPTKVKDLQIQFDHLQQKSGLTNDELGTMLGLNDNLTEKIPQATDKITEQGNRIAGTTDKMRKYNEEFAKDILRGYEKELNTAMANQEERLKRIKGLQGEHKAGLAEEDELRNLINSKTDEQLNSYAKKLQNQIDNNMLIGEERAKAEELILMINEKGRPALQSKLAILMEQNDELEKSIENEQKQIDKVDEIKKKMIDVVLEEVKLNGKKGDGIRLIDTEIARLIEQKRKLDAGTSAKEKTTAEYRNAVAAIDREIAKLHVARDAVAEITGAQRGVNSKVAEGIALAQRLNEALSKSINKTVNITEIKRLITQSERAARSIGVDTSRHQGGTFKLPEFHEGGSPALMQSLMNAPNHHEVDVRLLRKEMVLTEAQQGELFRRLDNRQIYQAPMSNAEVLSALYNIESAIKENNPSFSLEIDGEKFAEKTARPMAKHIERINTGSSRARGEY